MCFIPTASGDSPCLADRDFYRAMAAHDCRPADLGCSFDRTIVVNGTVGLPAFVAEQDVFWVWGGSTLNLLALWRLHGLDGLLARGLRARRRALRRPQPG